MWNRVLNRKAQRAAVTGALLACLLLSAAGGGISALAQGEQPQVPQVAGPALISYQALLLDPGTGSPKPNGTYQMVFALYDVDAGGTALWSETKTLQVDKGLFSTMLGDQVALPASILDGRTLWLGVTVGADPESIPRQKLGYTAGAIYAKNSDQLDGQHSTAFAAATHPHSGADITTGIVAEPRIDAAIARDGEIMPTVLANDGPGSNLDADTLDGQQASAFASISTIMPTVLANDGSGSTLDADLLDNLNSTAFARSTHAHSGADITTGTVAELRIDPLIARDGEIMPTVLANDGMNSTLDADLLDGQQGSFYQNASNINAGILDYPFFNAYGDLATDSRIGTGPSQVAAGDHLHDSRYYTQPASESRYVNVTGDTMSGELTVTGINYSPAKTEYYSVAAEDFQPNLNVNYSNSWGQAYIYQDLSGPMSAPVHLPHGAVVNQITIYFYDSSTTNLLVEFYAKVLSGGGGQYVVLASYTTSSTAGYGSATVPVNATINNISYGYMIGIYCQTWPTNDTLAIRGLSIRYTIAEAH